MLIDVLEIYGFAYSRLMVNFTRLGMQLQIIIYPPQVGLEVVIVYHVDAVEGGEKRPVSFGGLLAADRSPSFNSELKLTEAFEECF